MGFVWFVNWESGISQVGSFGSARGQRSLCFSLGALGFGLCAVHLPGSLQRAAGGARSGADILILVVCAFQLIVLLTAQLTCGGPETQCPFPVSLAEGVGAELAEGLRVFPADVTVVPGAVPAACRSTNQTDVL